MLVHGRILARYARSMRIGIDHLVIAVADPDGAAAELEGAVGLRASGGGRHEALGTFNRLVWLGDTYLELIGVFDTTLAAASWVGVPTLRALERGGGLATWALASDDLEADVVRLRADGAQLDGPRPGERTRPDGRTVRWWLAAPPRLGPDEPPFWIEHDTTAAEWTPAERAERAAELHPIGTAVRLEVLELPLPSPADVARRSLALLRASGLRFRPSLAGRGARDAEIGSGQRLRLVPAPSGAHPVVRLAADGAAALDEVALGVRFVVRQA
jgi:hypothetical protein